MKVLNQVLSLAVLAIAMTACGSSTPVTQPVANNGGGYYQNGQWIQTGQNGQPGQPGYTGQPGQGGCVPLTSQLSFTASGAQMSNTSILAGNFPQGTGLGTYGQVVMGGGFGGGAGSIQYQPKQSQNGSLQLFAGSANGMGTVSGTIQLAPYVVQQLQQMMGGNTYQNGTYPSAQQPICVNSVAVWAVQTVSGQTGYNAPQTGYINQAVVYLHMSNGQVSPPISF